MYNEIGTRTFLYAIDKEYNILRYDYIMKPWLSIPEIKAKANELKLKNPDAIGVYAVANSYDLYEQCKIVMKKHRVDDRVVFKNMIETEGIKVL